LVYRVAEPVFADVQFAQSGVLQKRLQQGDDAGVAEVVLADVHGLQLEALQQADADLLDARLADAVVLQTDLLGHLVDGGQQLLRSALGDAVA